MGWTSIPSKGGGWTVILLILSCYENHDKLHLDGPLDSSDQDRTFPHNINTISSKEVMRIKKNIN